MTKAFTAYVVPKNVKHVIGAQKHIIVIMITNVYQSLIIGTVLNPLYELSPIVFTTPL